jgi:hypothetical protein
MNRDNEIDARLGTLPRPKLDAVADARIHARTRAAFLGAATPMVPGRWARLWSRALEPAALAIALVVYLVWTTQALAAIDWGRLALPSMDSAGSLAPPRAAGGKQEQ